MRPRLSNHFTNTKNQVNRNSVQGRDKSMKISLNGVRGNSKLAFSRPRTAAGIRVRIHSEHMPDGIRFRRLSIG
jgi:hypothetical protein